MTDETVVQAGEPEQQAATPHTVTSASIGTALVTGAGSITGITMNQPTASSTDESTPLLLVDAAAAPTGYARTLYSASLRALACEYEPRPGIALTPGLTAPTWPKNISGISVAFTNGCWVQNCPANMTFTVTA